MPHVVPLRFGFVVEREVYEHVADDNDRAAMVSS